MLRKMLTAKWLAFGLLAVAAFATCLALGWWQWTRFLDGDGSFRNLGYTALWPVFGVFAIYLWWRLLADTVQADVEGASRSTDATGTAAADAEGNAGRSERPSWFTSPRVPAVELPYDPAERSARRQADEESDPELAAYNRYLASLNAGTGAGR